MKCDEVKPVCGPCAKGNRPCVYGAITKSSSNPATSDGEHGVSESPFRNSSDSQRPKPRFNEAVQPQGSWNVSASQAFHPVAPAAAESSRHDNVGADPRLNPPISWASFEEAHITSPQSTFSFNSEVAPLRWFGLLADDADIRSESISDHRTEAGSDVAAAANYPTPLHLNTPHLSYAHSLAPTSTPRSSVPTGDEKELWQSPTCLLDHEVPLFRMFVDDLSQWLDLFDPMKHFSTLVPQLAMNNEGILKAILALAARHSSLKQNAQGVHLDRTAAVQYYFETLQYLQRAMKYESYTKSLEILATALIVSTYEMIDGAGKSWERHLKGVFWIQRSQDNDGESGGLRQAVWWAWIRQDIWAAFREKRKCFSFC